MSGKLTRRTVMGTGAAAAALPRVALAQADRRPTVTVAVQRIATSNTLDIINEASNVGTRHYNLYHEPLIDTDWTGDLSLRPGLAESWTQVDGRTLDLQLRQGVRFHNGDVMTAEDVVYTFTERLFGTEAERSAPAGATRDPKWAPPKVRAGAKSMYGGIESVTALAADRVRITLGAPDITMLARLSMRSGVIVNAASSRRADTWLNWARMPVGTGPYRVAEYRAENRLVMEAFDDHWGGRPPIRELRFMEVPELASRINGLLAGEFDFACDITPDQIDIIERNPRYEVAGGLIANIRMLMFDVNHPELRDPRMRRALSLAIDRQAIIDSIWGGRTRIPRGLQFEFYGPMYDASRPRVAYDPALARKLAQEAGYKGGVIPYRLVNNYYTNQTATAQIMAEMWQAAGLNVKIEMRENWGQVLARNPERAIVDNSASSFFNDPVSFMPTSFGKDSDGAQNGFYRNAEVEGLMEELITSTDIPRRRAVLGRSLDILEGEDPAYMILHETANFTAKRRDIRWKPAGSFVMDFRSRNFVIG